MSFQHYSYTVTDRFIRYAQIDTQSDPTSPTCPSTEKQKNLSRLLVEELKEIGLTHVELDENGYVYALLPANTTKAVPTLCFCSHVDTSPDCSGANVKPLIHPSYAGQDIVLPTDSSQVIRLADHLALKDQIGNDIITADGSTLLGADNKAGVAEIMDAVHYLIQHPEIKHGPVSILFTPDEEIGRGVDKVNLQKVNAQIGYTVDGETLGHIENETFSADGATLTIHGVSTHPGFAKGKMENAMKIAGRILAKLPDAISPEQTSGKEPFIHPVKVEGSLESCTIHFIIRAFETLVLARLEQELEVLVKEEMKAFPNSSYTFIVTEQYRNMKEVLDKQPEIIQYAVKAIERSGVSPSVSSIRGGTDGSRLSYMGLPCANIFAGEHAFHSKQEWVSVQDMQKAVQTIVHLICIWEENA